MNVVSEQELDGWLEPEYIPNFWYDDNGVKHIVIWYLDSDYEFVKDGDGYRLVERAPF